MMKTVTVFGSSLPHEGSPAYIEAQRLGRLLAEAGYAVCNGGYGGLMEASARGAREAGGHTIGITCAVWSHAANPFIVEQVHTQSFPERLMTLIQRGDAYAVLPGGTGTLAELALVWEMMNKRALSSGVGNGKLLLAMAPYWQPVIDCLKQEAQLSVEEPARVSRALELVTLFETAEDAVDHIRRHWELGGKK